MLREARVLRALEGRARVPRVLAACDDDWVIGAPFYVMELVEGHVITTDAAGARSTAPADRARIADELVDALVEIHAVDWQEAGPQGFGKPTGYLDGSCAASLACGRSISTREIPAVDRSPRGSPAHALVRPATDRARRLPPRQHDVRVGSPARLVAVFDWEMATIGDPLADLGYLCTLWADRDDPPRRHVRASTRHARARASRLRGELIARYEERSGRSMPDLRWYQTLALWKSIVFMEGNSSARSRAPPTTCSCCSSARA